MEKEPKQISEPICYDYFLLFLTRLKSVIECYYRTFGYIYSEDCIQYSQDIFSNGCI